MSEQVSIPKTAAEYLGRARASKIKSAYLVTNPETGNSFLVTDPDMAGYVLVGHTPQSLLEEGLKAWGAKPDETRKTDRRETQNNLLFLRHTVVDNVVEPHMQLDISERVVLKFADGSEAPLDPRDFTFLLDHIQGKMEAAGGVRSFRKGRVGGVSAPRPHGKKRRRKVVSSGGA